MKLACLYLVTIICLGIADWTYAQSGNGSTLMDEGTAAYDRGDTRKAAHLLEEALSQLARQFGEDHPTTLAAAGNLATAYASLGQYNKALALNEKVLRLLNAKLGENHPDTLAAMGNLANTYSALGQYEKAFVLNKQALRIRLARLGEDHPDTLLSMNNLANNYTALGQYDKALVLIEQALRLKRTRLGEDHPDTLFSMGNLANIYVKLRQPDKALAVQEQALKLMRVRLGSVHPHTLAMMNNLAITYFALGHREKSTAIIEQALPLLRTRLGDDHPHTLKLMSGLALNYYALGQRKKALALVPAFVAGTEKMRVLPGLEPQQQQSLFAEWSDYYIEFSREFAEAGQMHKAFELGDLAKARTLTDSIRSQIALRSLPTAEQNSLLESEKKGRQLKVNLDRLVAIGMQDSKALLALQSDINSHYSAHAELVANLRRRFPKYEQQTALKPASPAQASKLLRDDEVFVSYLISRKGWAHVLLMNRSGNVVSIKLPPLKNLAQSIAATRTLLAPATPDGSPAPGQLIVLKEGGFQWLPVGEALPAGATSAAATPSRAVTSPEEALGILQGYWHSKLIKPILHVAAPYPRWIISPDKDLALLPFDVLVERYDDKGHPKQLLVETRNINLVQSFAVFSLLKQRDQEYANLSRPRILLAMGNAVYRDGWSEDQGKLPDKVRSFQAHGDRGLVRHDSLPLEDEQSLMQYFDWSNLPGTAREIDAVARELIGAGRIDRHTGQQASENRLQEINQAGQLKEYRYLLFSAHGYLARNPALSSLVLSRKGNPPGVDGYVMAEEWPTYDVRSDLTVLSACDTGVGTTQAGEGVMGLPYALFVAGNKNTLLSLWPVDDSATAEFMKRFFGHLASGESQPDALRATKLEFMRNSHWSAARYWAPFVLYGI